jgi:Spy/CpxP family protein refolding chaperone
MRARTTFAVLFLVALVSVASLMARAQTTQGATVQADAAHTLTDAQKQAIKRIQTDAEKQAAPAALRLAGIVNKIYENMLADEPDEKLRADLSAQMEKATWTLLSIKGQSIHDIVRVLTPAQRQLVKVEMQKPGAPSDLSEVVTHIFKLDEK